MVVPRVVALRPDADTGVAVLARGRQFAPTLNVHVGKLHTHTHT